MVRIKDVAEKANVSTATVSHVINNTGKISKETQKKVQKVIKELNYQPNRIAKSLKLKKTNTIGVIVEDITVFNAPEIIDGINKYADEHGWSIIMTNMRLNQLYGNKSERDEMCVIHAPKAAQELVNKQVDGILYIGVHARDMSGIMPKIKIPIVYTYCYTSEENGCYVNYNDEQTAYNATKYLIESGHKKIAIISGLINSYPSRKRFDGYYKALSDYNLVFNPEYVKTGDWEYESGYTQGKLLLQSKEPPTAILGMNDLMAAGAMKGCRELGLAIPDDLSVMGIDDREMSFFLNPSLTTMKIPLTQMGRLSMVILDKLVKGEKVEKPDLLGCKLVVRESVGPPPSN
ncbi:LacI family DNA-binding transcriptional regulator [Pullulanibacillus sp. KACC 23026]|uniref:LacI family DNA-binding transcriptional regulator n=1 Tax=Pullulanibacillus sp. KACC 23026 TaxID=3028315 RepID=UPI0023B0D12F|nr:LacI family DNA-binding transcriptional regulator [Pullulanibacillus sp. KACC 23026]WEG11192.1 LacI family DNA-binding transcriptional regulator [Pullulanibacillus sp. KACC 23026]